MRAFALFKVTELALGVSVVGASAGLPKSKVRSASSAFLMEPRASIFDARDARSASRVF